MSALWLDVRHAVRMMLKAPGLTAVLAITLALGLGASTTIFSVVSSVVLRPLPYDKPDRIVRLYTEFHKKDNPASSMYKWVGGSGPLAGGDRPVRVQVAYTTHTLGPLLGVAPQLGRWFDASEDSAMRPAPDQIVGDPSVIVLGHDIALGLAGAVVLQIVLDKSLQGLFYGSRLSQPLLLVGVAIAVAATALLATWIPARRATRIEPMVALRSE